MENGQFTSFVNPNWDSFFLVLLLAFISTHSDSEQLLLDNDDDCDCDDDKQYGELLLQRVNMGKCW